MKESHKLILSSYLRSFIVALAAIITTGEEDMKVLLLNALAVGVVGPAIRALNPKDEAFGVIASKAEQSVKGLAKKKKAAKKK